LATKLIISHLQFIFFFNIPYLLNQSLIAFLFSLHIIFVLLHLSHLYFLIFFICTLPCFFLHVFLLFALANYVGQKQTERMPIGCQINNAATDWDSDSDTDTGRDSDRQSWRNGNECQEMYTF